MTAHELLIRHREVSRLARLLTELLTAVPGQAAPEREAGLRLRQSVERLLSAEPDGSVLRAVRDQLDELATRSCLAMQEHCKTVRLRYRRLQQQRQQHCRKVETVSERMQERMRDAVQQVEQRLKQEWSWNRRQLAGSLGLFLEKSLCCHEVREDGTVLFPASGPGRRHAETARDFLRQWQKDMAAWLQETCTACSLRMENRSRDLLAALHGHARALLSYHPDIFSPEACQHLADLLPQGIGADRPQPPSCPVPGKALGREERKHSFILSDGNVPMPETCDTLRTAELRQACEVVLARFMAAEEKRLNAVLQRLFPAVQDFCRVQVQAAAARAPSAEQQSVESRLRAGEALLRRMCAARDDLRDLKGEL